MLITYIWMILDDHLLPIKTMFVWMLFFELLNLDPKLFGSKLQVVWIQVASWSEWPRGWRECLSYSGSIKAHGQCRLTLNTMTIKPSTYTIAVDAYINYVYIWVESYLFIDLIHTDKRWIICSSQVQVFIPSQEWVPSCARRIVRAWMKTTWPHRLIRAMLGFCNYIQMYKYIRIYIYTLYLYLKVAPWVSCFWGVLFLHGLKGCTPRLFCPHK